MNSKQIRREQIATLVLAVTMLFAPFMIRGQSPEIPPEPAGEATLQGVVRDSGNRPVVGATVCLQAKAGKTVTERTDSRGAYRFSALRKGQYALRAEMNGYDDTTFSPVVLARKESRTIDLRLASARAGERQDSSAGRPEFFDEPHFAVAGVTDTTNLGGHGSDTIVRNREAMAQATASLRTDDSGNKTDGDEAEQHRLLGDAEERLGNSLEAAREYQRAAELNPSEPNLFDWGTELLLHRAAEPAIEVFTEGNRMFPRSVRMLVALGAAWYANGSYDRAAEHLCEASDLNPDDPNPYLFMGKMQAAETAPSEAIVERLSRFVSRQPQNALANYYYAVSLRQRRKSPENAADFAQVKSLLEKAVSLDPKLGLAYLQLGILYSEQRDFAKAISAYRRAIESAPQMEQAHYRLAQAYRQSGESSKAQAELQTYEKISKEKTQEIERQRHEVQQFVYELRDRPPASQPQQKP